jgi:bifunctional UDP-N-acetylglucosamine pyrophosphorylase/glucosamine-1-phosphate N-acetyltransferase
MKAVILAANYSPRLLPFTATRAKPMIRIAGRHILESILDGLHNAGVHEALVVVHHEQQALRDHFGDGGDFGMGLEYVEQPELLGIGHALSCCEPYLKRQPFLLVYGDVLADGNPVPQLLRAFAETGREVALVTLPRNSNEYGNVYLDNEMKIRRFIEKPQGRMQSNYVFAGGFVLQPRIFDLLRQHDQSIEACYQYLVQNDGLQADLWEGTWIDVVYPWHILEANQMMMSAWRTAHIHQSAKVAGNVQLEGPVVIERNVVIESGAVLKGPCFIGEGSYIGNNSLVRTFSAIGPNSVVGYGSELKNCVLFGKSDLGRLSFIGDSVIGEGVSLGTALTTVNHFSDGKNIVVSTANESVDSGLPKLGAFIGDGVRIGARQTLAPATIVPAGSFIEDNISLRGWVPDNQRES